MKVEEVKVISGLRAKSETKKKEKPGKMHAVGNGISIPLEPLRSVENLSQTRPS